VLAVPRVLAVCAALVACSRSDEPPEPAAKSGSARPGALGVVGEVAIDGKPASPTACRPGTGASGTFIQIDTTRGAIRFEDKQLSIDGVVVACKKLDRSWGGGHRANGTSYWRGMLDVDCDRVRGRLDIDCGDITAEERAQLDANRKEMREQQAR